MSKKQNVSKQGIPVNKAYEKAFLGADEPAKVSTKPQPKPQPKRTVVVEQPKSFAKLAGLLTPEPAEETVSAVALALEETPEYAIWQQALSLQADADRAYTEAKKILGDEHLDELEARIESLQSRMFQFRTKTKDATLNAAGIAGDRVKFLEKFGEFITKKVLETVQSDPAYVSMAEELRTAVANAMRVNELRQVDETKEKEAQALLDSISFNLA